jgi:catechol 2,3-dioxygenase-like lactoylglutathione lyase family enzyme
MLKPNGVHHLVVSTADMRSQLEFFSDVLGMDLVAIYPMHGVDGATHAFVRANDRCYIAFVTMPAIEAIPVEVGKTHSGWAGAPSAAGTMQHVAFNVDTEADLLAMRDRIRLKGVNVLGPIDHGMCKSIYFAGPETLTLEVAASDEAINPKLWIDPVEAERIGISPEDLERLSNPQPIPVQAGPVPQPPVDETKPHFHLPKDEYDALLSMSDDELAAAMDFAEPPQKAAVD